MKMNIQEVSKLFGVHPTTIYLWIKDNKIRATKEGKSYSFDTMEVDRVKALLDRGARLPVIPKGIVDLSKVNITGVKIVKGPEGAQEVPPEGTAIPVTINLSGLDKKQEAQKIALELRATIGQVDDNWGVKTKIQKAIDFITREFQL